MTKADFYSDRIFWRAQKHNLLQKRCLVFSELTDAQLEKVTYFSPKGLPVLIFWDNETLWTVLTTEEVLSFHESSIHRIELDKIGKEIRVELDENSVKPKFSTEFLFVGSDKIKIWVFSGYELYALFSILRMFPLNYIGDAVK